MGKKTISVGAQNDTPMDMVGRPVQLGGSKSYIGRNYIGRNLMLLEGLPMPKRSWGIGEMKSDLLLSSQNRSKASN